MSQDIEYIKAQIKNCEELEDLFELKRGDKVKYITLVKGSEYFYDGGEYVKMIDNAVCIKCNGKIENVTISYFTKEGKPLYNSRFFVENGECMSNKKDALEYEKIIKNQQKIIEVLTKENNKLKNVIQKNMLQ